MLSNTDSGGKEIFGIINTLLPNTMTFSPLHTHTYQFPKAFFSFMEGNIADSEQSFIFKMLVDRIFAEEINTLEQVTARTSFCLKVKSKCLILGLYFLTGTET